MWLPTRKQSGMEGKELEIKWRKEGTIRKSSNLNHICNHPVLPFLFYSPHEYKTGMNFQSLWYKSQKLKEMIKTWVLKVIFPSQHKSYYFRNLKSQVLVTIVTAVFFTFIIAYFSPKNSSIYCKHWLISWANLSHNGLFKSIPCHDTQYSANHWPVLYDTQSTSK